MLNIMTKEELKELIREEAQDLIEKEGYIKADELEEKSLEGIKETLTDEMKATFDAEIAELAKTPKEEEKDIKPDEEETSKEIDPKGGYDSFAEFAKDVADAGNPHRGIVGENRP